MKNFFGILFLMVILVGCEYSYNEPLIVTSVSKSHDKAFKYQIKFRETNPASFSTETSGWIYTNTQLAVGDTLKLR